MKVSIQPTPMLVEVNGTTCRQWIGTTDRGLVCVVMVAAIGIPDDAPEADREAFDRELVENLPKLGAKAIAVIVEPEDDGSN